MRCWKPAHPRHGEIRGSLSDVARLVPPEAVALKGVLEVAPPIIQTGVMNFKHVMYCILKGDIAYILHSLYTNETWCINSSCKGVAVEAKAGSQLKLPVA